MALSQVLRAQELTLLIAQHVDIPASGFARKPTHVARMARVCKAMHGPATEVLWSNLPSLVPLLKLLPQQMWTLVPNSDTFVYLAVTGDIPATSSDPLNIFIQRAAMMKSLRWNTERAGDIKLNSSSVDWLISLRDIGMLFPSLRELLWNNDDGPAFWAVLQILGPNLKVLNVECYPWFEPARFIPILCNWTDLETLTIGGQVVPKAPGPLVWEGVYTYEEPDREDEMIRPPSSVIEALQTMPNLRDIVITGCDLNTAEFRLLVQLPFLDRLLLTMEGGWFTIDEPEQIHEVPGHLSRIKFYGKSGEWDMNLEAALGYLPITLKELVVTAPLCVGADQLSPYLETLSETPFAGTMEHLRIFSECCCGDFCITDSADIVKTPDAPTIFDCDVFQPLLALTSLRSLNLVLSHLSMSVEFLGEMARAMPRIEEFIIVHRQALDPDSSIPSADALIAFAQYCPRLVVLGLDLEIDEVLPPAPRGLEQTSLRVLEVGQGYIVPCEEQGASEIATYVKTIFPGLERISKVFHKEDHGELEAWLDVHEHLHSSRKPLRRDSELVPEWSYTWRVQ